RKLNEIRATIARPQKDDALLHWARWFLADRRTRTISPFSQRKVTDEGAVNVETSTPVPITSTAVNPVPPPVPTLTTPSLPPSTSFRTLTTPESSDNSEWLTSTEYQQEFDAKKSESYPAIIEGRCHDGREEFRALWKRLPLRSAFESRHGITKQ